MEVDELTWLVSLQAVDVLPGNNHFNEIVRYSSIWRAHYPHGVRPI